ncbi:MAG: CpaD family pilus assembly lipoprotein [Pseudomonadota bacterium]
MTKYFGLLLAGSTAIILAAGCSSSGLGAVPVEYLDTPMLERHEIDVRAKTEVLEITLDPLASDLPREDRDAMSSFFRYYKAVGHGPLTMLLPEEGSDPQFAVGAIATAREIAFASGVNYEEISGGARPSENGVMRVLLSFKRYEAIAPNCQSLGDIDISNVRSNGDLSNLGCSVRTNMAAMIADPGDLLGTRPISPGDAARRQLTFEQWRRGEQTASQRNTGESGAVSDAVAAQTQ